MSEHRLNKNETEYYSSLAALRLGWGMDPVEKKRKKDPDALQNDRDKFLGKCPACHGQLIHVEGSNYKVCGNDKCRGVEVKSKEKDEDGNIKKHYIPFIKTIIDEKSSDKTKEIFHNLFD